MHVVHELVAVVTCMCLAWIAKVQRQCVACCFGVLAEFVPWRLTGNNIQQQISACCAYLVSGFVTVV